MVVFLLPFVWLGHGIRGTVTLGRWPHSRSRHQLLVFFTLGPGIAVSHKLQVMSHRWVRRAGLGKSRLVWRPGLRFLRETYTRIPWATLTYIPFHTSVNSRPKYKLQAQEQAFGQHDTDCEGSGVTAWGLPALTYCLTVRGV